MDEGTILHSDILPSTSISYSISPLALILKIPLSTAAIYLLSVVSQIALILPSKSFTHSISLEHEYLINTPDDLSLHSKASSPIYTNDSLSCEAAILPPARYPPSAVPQMRPTAAGRQLTRTCRLPLSRHRYTHSLSP